MSLRARAVAVVVSIGVFTAGCTSGGKTPEFTPEQIRSMILAGGPSQYMLLAVLNVRYSVQHKLARPYFAPVLEAGRTWTGDPSYYEKLCGGDITTPTGEIVDITNAATYLDLPKDAKRWATFNAWLQDPAVYRHVIDQLDSRSEYDRGVAFGPTTGCPAFHPQKPPPYDANRTGTQTVPAHD